MQYDDKITPREKRLIQSLLRAGRKLVLNEKNGMIPEKNGFSRPRMEQIIKQLEESGMITRKRTGEPELTAAGKEYFELPEEK